MASSTFTGQKRSSDDGNLSQSSAAKKRKGAKATSSGASVASPVPQRRSTWISTMEPPSQTSPTSPTEDRFSKLEDTADNSTYDIVDIVEAFLSRLDLRMESEYLRDQLHNRRIDVNEFLKQIQSKNLAGRPSLRSAELVFEDFDIPQDLSKSDRRSMDLLQEHLQQVRPNVVEFVKALIAQPAPSSYGVPKTAQFYQQGERPILCLRPHNRRGVPITMLHDVFLSFARDAEKEPRTADKSLATWMTAQAAAKQLCLLMSDFFDKEAHRRDSFNELTKALYNWQKEYQISASSEVHGGIIDSCSFSPLAQMLVIREDKLEACDTKADAYLQACRDYQILVSKLKYENSPFVAQGIPVFILTIIGPQLTVCGAFWDGEHEIVEPLAPPCLMLPDFGGPREQRLARLLYWLKVGMISLSEAPSGVKTFKPGVPRIYETFTVATDGVGSEAKALTFLKSFENPIKNHLMFVAEPALPSTLTIPRRPRFLVKFTFKKYGRDVHQYLASRNLAPKYHGDIPATTDVTPTGHVMEYMQDGWESLYSFRQGHPELEPQLCRTIASKVRELLNALSAGGFVHGDLRSNNIIIKVGQDGKPVMSGGNVEIMAVDFDWAGISGSVTYPPGLNTDIKWEAAPGEAMLTAHDTAMVKQWWEKEFGCPF